jgi:hypothetical protein
MSNETTQLQKAIVIAKKDGFACTDSDWLLKKYTTDLNYLMPIASIILLEFKKRYQEWDVMVDECRNLHHAYVSLNNDTNNQYTELFNALFNAIKLLENE